MKRAEAMRQSEPEIMSIMMDVYMQYQDIYTTIYVSMTDGTIRTYEHVSENSYLADSDLYPVWTCNPARQYADDREDVYQAELEDWVYGEYRNALHWAESDDDAEEE